MSLAASNCRDALYEIKDAIRFTIFLTANGFNDFRCLGLGEPVFAQKALAILVRAGDEFAKLVRAGAASWANRCAANLEWRMVICSKFSTPHRLRFMQMARR